MKTRFLAIVVLMLSLVGITAVAQDEERGGWRVIPRVGMDFTTLRHQTYIPEVGAEVKAKSRLGLTAGVDAEYMLTPSLGIMPGLHYTQQGCNYPDYGSDAMRVTDAGIRTHYLALPLRLRWWIADCFSVATGIQAAYLFSANSKLTVHSPGEDAGKIDTDIVGLCHRMDFAVPFEAYLCLGKMEYGVAYNLSINKFHRPILEESRVRNSVFRVTIGYRFGL